MNAAALILLQAAAVPAGPPADPPPPNRLEAMQHCGPGRDGEIVVCAKPTERSPYRLPLAVAPEPGNRKLAFHLPGDVNGDVHLEQHSNELNGIPDHRIMVDLTKKF